MRRKVRNIQKSTQSSLPCFACRDSVESFYAGWEQTKSLCTQLHKCPPSTHAPSLSSSYHPAFLFSILFFGRIVFWSFSFLLFSLYPWSNTFWFNSPYTFSEDPRPPRNQTFGTDFSKNCCYLSGNLPLRLLWYHPAGFPLAGLTSSFLKVVLVSGGGGACL